MPDVERRKAVAVALEHVSRRQLDEPHLIGELPDDTLERIEECDETARPVDGQRQVAAAKGERLHHPRQAEHVVRVEVRQEDLLEIDEADGRAKELPLRPLCAVEQELVSAAAHEQRSRCAARGRHRARRTEKHEVEIHGSIVGLPVCGRSPRHDLG
jgi:hypothetical protein